LILRLEDHAPLVLVVAAEFDRAVDLGDDRMVLGTPRLKQLRHPRWTAGDVARLGALHRNTGQHVAGLDYRARLDRKDRVDRQEVAPFRAAASSLASLLVLALDDDRRLEVGAARVGPPVDDDALGDAGRF